MNSQYPYGIGGEGTTYPNTLTQYDCAAVDSQMNVVVAGFSLDIGVCASSTSPRCILIEYIDEASTKKYKWSKAILGITGVSAASFPQSVAAIKFSTTVTAFGEIVAVLEKPTASSPLILMFLK